MLFAWDKWLWMSGSPFLLFAILLLFSHACYLILFKPLTTRLSSGYIVLSLAVTILYALQRIKIPAFIPIIAAYELMIVWLYLIFELFQKLLRGRLLPHAAEQVIACIWVAATAFSVLVLDRVEPYLLGVITLVAITAIVMWFGVMMVMVNVYWQFIKSKTLLPHGLHFLFATATASIIVLIEELFHENFSDSFYAVLFDFCIILYGLSIIQLVYSFYQRQSIDYLLKSGLHYSSLAMIGIAGVLTHAADERFLYAMWQLTMLFFMINCVCWLINIHQRWYCYRHRRWISLFNLAIIYGFAQVFYDELYLRSGLLAIIANYGHVIVLVAAFLQIASSVTMLVRLYLHSNLRTSS